jgi:chromosome segregation ATPase
MSEDTTKDMPDTRSFEERVFARFDAMDARFNTLDDRLTKVETRMKGLELHMTDLEEKVDRRLMETRPMWEAVQAQLEKLNEKLDTLNDKFDLVTSDLYDMRTRIKSLNKRVTNLEDAQPQ